jgi:hypothetical protein
MNYDFNKQAENIAAQLINKYHTHLNGIKIAYVFKVKTEKPDDKKPKRGRKPSVLRQKKIVMAKTSLVNSKYRILFDEDYRFLIDFNIEIWNELTLDQQMALVDHELCHCGLDENGIAYLIPHSVEEFRQIITRYGFWKDDVKAFADVCKAVK